MAQQNIMDLAKERILLLDGGMGSELIRYGFSKGECPEFWNIDKPDTIRNIHKSYFDAGSDIILTNSFGGSKLKLASYGLEERCHELNYATAKLANEVRPDGKFIGGSMGPVGKFLKPQGEYTETEFEQSFTVQAKALTLGKVDFLLIETMYDLREALCALRGARAVSHLPVFVTMTFSRTPRGFYTLMGNSVSDFFETMEKEGVPILGANCTLDSKDMAELVGIMRAETSKPLIIQANAGQPVLSEDGNVVYSQDVDDYTKYIPEIIKNGANIIGGCCGTTPEYIRRIAEILENHQRTVS